MSGLFITLEGGEGSGKSTQSKLLKNHLEAHGHTVVTTREPGGPAVSEAIRQILLDPKNTELTSTTELLLYEAARAQHVAQTVRPALNEGAVVICDRFYDSTSAYQGAGRGLAPDDLERLHQIATEGLTPDLTILIDLPAEEGLARASKRQSHDRIEQESIEFHKKVREGFLSIAKREAQRVFVVDGLLSIEEIATKIAERVATELDSRNLTS